MGTKTLFTVADLADLPDEGRGYEIDEGELVAKPETNKLHEWTKTRVTWFLAGYSYSTGHGSCFCETGWVLERHPTVLRRPDVSFVTAEKLAHGTDVLESADLCIEVVSSETAAELDRKLRQYFATGARAVWVLYIEPQTVYVYSSPTSVRILTADQVLEDATLLPGFSVIVRDLFPPEPRQEK